MSEKLDQSRLLVADLIEKAVRETARNDKDVKGASQKLGKELYRKASKPITEEGQQKYRETTKAANAIADGARLVGLATDCSRRQETLKAMKSLSNNLSSMDHHLDFAYKETITKAEYKEWHDQRYKTKFNIAPGHENEAISAALTKKLNSWASMNIVESNMRAHPELFSKKENEILQKENGVFDFQSSRDIDRTIVMFQKYLKAEGGKFKDIDPRSCMSEGKLKALIGSKIDNQDEAALVALVKLTESKKYLNSIGARKHYTAGKIFSKYTTEKMYGDSEVIQTVKTTAKYAKLANKTRLGVGGLVLNFNKGGNFIIGTLFNGAMIGSTWVIDKFGFHSAAGKLAGSRIKIIQLNKKVSKVIKPGTKEIYKVWRKPVSGSLKLVGKGIWAIDKKALKLAAKSLKITDRKMIGKSSKYAKLRNKLDTFKLKGKGFITGKTNRFKVIKSKLFTPAKNILGKIGTVASTPFRAMGWLLDKLKKWIMVGALAIIAVPLLVTLFMQLAAGSGETASTPAFTIIDSKEHFTNPTAVQAQDYGFQEKYDECNRNYEATVYALVNGTPYTKNIKGETLERYGVSSEGFSGGADTTESGVYQTYDGVYSDNLYDIVTAMAILMSQRQYKNHTEALELVEALYNSSHTFEYEESPLYPCEAGCADVSYICSDYKDNYESSDLKYFGGSYSGWVKNELFPTDEIKECEVCADAVEEKVLDMKYREYAGCIARKNEDGTLDLCCHEGYDYTDENGRTHSHVLFKAGDESAAHSCSNLTPVSITYWEDTSDYSCGGCQDQDGDGINESCPGTHNDGPISHSYNIYVCGGHEHYTCEGHTAHVCFGHVNLTVTHHLKTFEQLFELGGLTPLDKANLPTSIDDEQAEKEIKEKVEDDNKSN